MVEDLTGQLGSLLTPKIARAQSGISSGPIKGELYEFLQILAAAPTVVAQPHSGSKSTSSATNIPPPYLYVC